MQTKIFQKPLLKALLFSSATSTFLLVFRISFSNEITYCFLIWNLFLAWIPMLLVSFISKKLEKISFRIILLLCLWLLFFPNSPYIITDLVHLRPKQNIPMWFDIILIVSFAWNGLILGFTSLLEIHKILFTKLKTALCWSIVTFLLVLSSFGVYLGRFERWNSWDIVTNPSLLFFNILDKIIHPFSNIQAIGVTLVFSLFLISSYATLFFISKQYQNEHS